MPAVSGAASNELRNAPRPTNEALIGIRGIAATWVVIVRFALYDLFRSTKLFDPWIVGANLGIEIFFPISGFIISYLYADLISAGAVRHGDYLVKRSRASIRYSSSRCSRLPGSFSLLR